MILIRWRIGMIGNYLKVTFRTLLKHKVFSIINIAGLALSISVCLMIIIFIKDQKSSDGFHEKKDRIVSVYTTDRNIEHSEVKGWATTPGSLAPYLLDNVPCVEDVVQSQKDGRQCSENRNSDDHQRHVRGTLFFSYFQLSVEGR